MAQLPYNPVPNVQPTETPTPMFRLNVNAQSFGGGVASALQDLGSTESKVGDELMQRALSLQELRNETEAREADAQYMIRAGELYGQYDSLRGLAAVQAHPKFMQDMQDERQKFRDGLSNDQARRLYDNSSLSTMGRTIFGSARHLGEQNKAWAAKASEARVDAMRDQALGMPKDDVAFQRSLNASAEEIRNQAAIGGWGDDQTNHVIAHTQSQLWSQRVIGLARTNPFQAKDMLEANRQKILGQDIEKVEGTVRQQLHTVGARNISDSTNGGWASYMKSPDIDRAVGVDDNLLNIVKEAQRANPDLRFTIGGQGGLRTPAEQKELVARGVSKTLDSNHLYGRAIDLVPLDDRGKPDYNDKQSYARIERAMEDAAVSLGIPLGPEHDKIKSWDPGHFSLPRDYDVSTAPKVPEEPLQQRIDRGVAYAKSLSPEDTTFAETVRDRIETDFTRAKAIKRDQDFTNRNTIDGALVGGYQGKVPTTVEELRALDPRVAGAFDNLDETHQRNIMRALAQNAKGDTAWNPDSLRRYQELKGMASADPVDFLGVNVIAEKFPNRTKLELLNLQNKLQSNAESDPRLTRAISILGPEMQAAGLNKEQSKDRYYQFLGSLRDQLEDFQQVNHRPPKPEELQKIGSLLMLEQHTHFWQSSERFFEQPVPADVAAQIKADPAWNKLGQEPTDKQVRQLYFRRQYNSLYGGSAKAKPEIPQSK